MRPLFAIRRVSTLFVLCGSVALGQAGPSASASGAPAEKNASKPAGTAPDLTKEALVVEQYHTRIRMDGDGTGARETTARIRVQADAGVKAMAVLPITYSACCQQVDIAYVRVRKSDGSVIDTPEYNVQDMPAEVSREAPLYSDVHQKHVAVRGLGVGDTLEYQVTQRIVKPEVPGQFWLEYAFEKNLIVLDEQLDLDVPADKAVTVVSAEKQPTITTVAGRKLYHWAATNFSHPDLETSRISTAKKHVKPSVQVTTFSSWEQVGAWYQSLQSSSLTVTPAIKAHAEALTRGLTTDADKVRAIANDVALHIHYVGLDFGIGRYQPHAADDVLANEYGDCKDKHTLLAALLKAVGIDAWPVLISSQRDLDPAVPSPAQFDHVITVVPTGSSLTWIDSTAEIAPIGTLMPPLRDKQALAIPATKAAYLERTAARPPSLGSIRMDVDAQLSGQGVLKGRITETASGDVEMGFRLIFRRTPQSQWKEVVQQLARSEGYGGETADPQISDIEQIDRPFVLSFDYTREKYYEWDSSRATHWVAPPLPPMGQELPDGVNEKKPTENPSLGYTGKTVYRAVLHLPPGWTMTPPQNVDINEDWLEYRASYGFKDGVFIAERSMVVKRPEVPLVQWERYLAFRRGMFDDWTRQVLLRPAMGAPASAPSYPVSTQDMLATVKDDSLDVYAEMNKDSDVVQTLPHGTVVRVGLAVTTGDGRLCTVFNNDTSEKLGFVVCNGLEMGSAAASQPSSSASPAASSRNEPQ